MKKQKGNEMIVSLPYIRILSEGTTALTFEGWEPQIQAEGSPGEDSA